MAVTRRQILDAVRRHTPQRPAFTEPTVTPPPAAATRPTYHPNTYLPHTYQPPVRPATRPAATAQPTVVQPPTPPTPAPTADTFYQPGGEQAQYQGLSDPANFPDTKLSAAQLEYWKAHNSEKFVKYGGQQYIDWRNAQPRAPWSGQFTPAQQLNQLPPDQRGQEFGLPPGDPATTMRGKLAEFMGAPLPYNIGTRQNAVAALSGAAPAAMAGAGVGAILGPAGAVIGGLAGGTFGAYLGWQSSQADFDQNSLTGQIMRWLNGPFQEAGKIYGLIDQMRATNLSRADDINTISAGLQQELAGGAPYVPNDPARLAANAAKYGTPSEIIGSWDQFKAAFEAGGDELVYRSANIDPRLVTQLPALVQWATGELTGNADQVARARAAVGDIPITGDDTRVFVDYDLPAINGGTLALVEARRRIANPSAQDIAAAQTLGISVEQYIRTEIAARFGAGAEGRTLVAGFTPLDPLSWAPEVAVKGLGHVAGLAGFEDVARAAELTEGPTSFMQAYRNILVSKEMPAFRESWRAAQDLNWAQKLIVGRELVNLAEAGTWQTPKWYEFWRLTPESAAKENIVQFSNHLQTSLAQLPVDENYPAAAADFLTRLKGAKLDVESLPPELQDAARLSLSFEGRVAQRALDTSAAEDLARAWQATAPDRQLLRDVATAAGDTPEGVLRRIAAGEGEALLLQLRKAATEQGEAGAALLGKLDDGSLNAKTLAGLQELFGKESIPYTPEMARARLMYQTMEAAGAWAVQTFGIKSQGFIEKLAGALKGIESVALLGLNFTYPLKNFINGELSMIARGVFGLRGANAERELLRRANLDPARLSAGSSLADLGNDMAGGLEGGAWKAIGEARAGEPEGVAKFLDEVRSGTARITEKLPPTWVAEKIEKWQSVRAVGAGFRQMWSQVWRRGVGFDRMPAALEQGLRAIDRRLPDFIYAAVESGLNPQEIAGRILADAPAPVLEQFAEGAARRAGVTPETVARLLAVDGLGDRINQALARGDDVGQVFDDVKGQAQQALDAMAADELATHTEHAAAVVQTQGPDGLLRMMDDMEQRLYETAQMHDQALASEWEQVRQQRQWKSVIIAKMRARAEATWMRYFEYERAMHQGLVDGLAAAGLKLDDGFMPALEARQKFIADFHTAKQALLDDFFSREFGDDTARAAAWAETQRRGNALYAQLADDVQRQQAALDDYLTALIGRDSSPAHGEAVAAWRKALRDFNRDDMEQVLKFRESLAGMNAGERDAAWRAFNDERLKRRAAMVQQSIELRRQATAAGSVPPVSGGETGARVPAQQDAALGTPAAEKPTSPEIARLEESLANARAELKRARAAAKAESGTVGPAHQALQQAEKRVKALAMQLSAERKAVGKTIEPAGGNLAPDSPALESEPLAERLAAHADVQEAAAGVTLATAGHDHTYAPITRAELRRQFIETFKVSEAEADAVLALTDARALAWANAQGRAPDEWYAGHVAGVEAGGAGELQQDALSRVLDYLDNVPRSRRRPGDLGTGDIVGYHITRASDAEAILRDGLQSRSSEQSYTRPSAVYLFLDADEVNAGARGTLLGKEPAVALRVRIPADEAVRNMEWDALWNAPSGDRSAVKYFADIPAEWIERSDQALYQGPKGAVSFLDDGRAIIHALEAPDVSTLVHEVGHIFRRDLAGGDLAEAERWADVTDGVWTREAEEQFARGFESYLATGRAPLPFLVRVFEQFKQWLGDIYATARGWLTGVQIDAEMRGVYDRLLIPTERVTNLRQALTGGRIMAEPDLHFPVPVIGDAADTVRVRLPDGTERNVVRSTIYYAERGVPQPGAPPAAQAAFDQGLGPRYEYLTPEETRRAAKRAVIERRADRRAAIERSQQLRSQEQNIRRYQAEFRVRQAAVDALPPEQRSAAMLRLHDAWQRAVNEHRTATHAELLAAIRGEGVVEVAPEVSPAAVEVSSEVTPPPTAAPATTLKQALQQPRDQLPPELSQMLMYVAQDMREDILSGEPGGLIFDRSGPGTEVTSYGSAYAEWYGDFLEKYRTKKDAVLKALDKIVADNGYDKGVMVTRLKRLGLERLAEGIQGMPPEPEALRLLGKPEDEIARARDLWAKLNAELPPATDEPPGKPLFQGETLPGGVHVGQVIELNGKRWTVEGWDAANQMYQVVDAAGSHVFISREALNHQPPAFMSQAAAAALGVTDPMPHAQAYEEAWYKSMLPVLDGLQAEIEADRRLPARLKGVGGSDGAALDPGLRTALDGWLRQTYGQMAPAKLTAVKWGEFTRDAALLNYSRRFMFNNQLGLVAPFEFFMSHSMIKWLLHSFDRPTWLSNYYRLSRTLNTAVTKPGFPSRLAGRVKLPMPMLPEWAGGGIWVDPLQFGLPLDTFLQPWEQAQQATTQQDQQTQRKLDELLRGGQISQAEYDQAASDHNSPAYQRAVQLVAADGEAQRFDGLDFASVLASPHLPLMWAYQAARGTPERIGPLPLTRQLRALTAVLGIGGPGGVNLEADIRRRNDLPIYDEFEDYRIDRALADMAAEGLISYEQAEAAQIERSGRVFELAQQRSAEQSGYGTVLGMILGVPGQVYPEGEARDRLLAQVRRAAYEAQDNGNPQPLADFLRDHPEYEARLALSKNPEERLRNFLIDRVWTGWRALPDLYRHQLQDTLGDQFNDAFLSSETRDYASIPAETLATWARTLGQYVPGNQTGDPLPIEWAPPEVARDAQLYYAMRRQVFTPEIRALQTSYFNIPEDERVPLAMPTWVQSYYTQRDAVFPGIRDTLAQYDALYGDARRAFRKAHPEIGDYLDWRAFVKRQQDDFGRYIGSDDEYRGSRTARSAFLAEHPELAAAWDADRAWLDQRPWVRPYVKPPTTADSGQADSAPKGVQIMGSPELQRLVTAYLFGGATLPAEARAVLSQAWQAQGQPNGSLNAWLLEVMAFGGNLGLPASESYQPPAPAGVTP